MSNNDIAISTPDYSLLELFDRVGYGAVHGPDLILCTLCQAYRFVLQGTNCGAQGVTPHLDGHDLIGTGLEHAQGGWLWLPFAALCINL